MAASLPPSPNKLHHLLCQELAKQLSDHRVLLVFDPGQQLRTFLDDVASTQPSGGEPGVLNLGYQQPRWLVAGSSLYQLRSQLEPLLAKHLPGSPAHLPARSPGGRGARRAAGADPGGGMAQSA